MDNYQHLLKDIMIDGEDRDDRTGVGTRSIFDTRLVFDMKDGFPAVTTKKLAFKSVIGELLWFINGETTLSSLRYRTFGSEDIDKPTIWDANQADFVKRRNEAKEVGVGDDCGQIYGNLWHRQGQFWNAIDTIINNPTSRRIMVNAWLPHVVNDDLKVALPPCHYGFQFYVHTDGRLDLKWTQRSVDAFLGLPFNIASYAALLHIVCELTSKTPGRVIFSGGDTHIYHNHFDAVHTQLSREAKPLPTLDIDKSGMPFTNVDRSFGLHLWLGRLTAKDFNLIGYDHHPAIKADMAV